MTSAGFLMSSTGWVFPRLNVCMYQTTYIKAYINMGLPNNSIRSLGQSLAQVTRLEIKEVCNYSTLVVHPRLDIVNLDIVKFLI